MEEAGGEIFVETQAGNVRITVAGGGYSEITDRTQTEVEYDSENASARYSIPVNDGLAQARGTIRERVNMFERKKETVICNSIEVYFR